MGGGGGAHGDPAMLGNPASMMQLGGAQGQVSAAQDPEILQHNKELEIKYERIKEEIDKQSKKLDDFKQQ